MAESNSLPRVNPFLSYLADGVRCLNQAVLARAMIEGQSGQSGWPAALSRSSAMHTIGAIHSAFHSGIFFEDGFFNNEWSLLEKAEAFLKNRVSKEARLPEEERRLLEELEVVKNCLIYPEMRQAEPFPSEKKNLIQFPRSPIKKIGLEVSTWVPEYAACVLAISLGSLRRIFCEYVRLSESQLEIYLGDHISNSEGYGNSLNPKSKEILLEEIATLRSNEGFMRGLKGPRWCLDSGMFSVDFLPLH